MDKIIKVREGLINMQICTTISPEEKHTINEELSKNGLSDSGTTNGWMLDENIDPVKCDKEEGRWHYICVC